MISTSYAAQISRTSRRRGAVKVTPAGFWKVGTV
jgi:hypothetical protein